eukprot:7400199-Pyramimonas_sp.AAC.1
MYTPGSRLHQEQRSCANLSAGSEKASLYRARFPKIRLQAHVHRCQCLKLALRLSVEDLPIEGLLVLE